MMTTHLVCSEQLLTGASYEYGTSLLFDASQSGQRPMALDLKAHSFVIARSSQLFATEAQTFEEIKYVQRYAKDAGIANSQFNEAA